MIIIIITQKRLKGISNIKKIMLYLQHTSHLWRKNTGAHYYVLNFQTIIWQLKRTGEKNFIITKQNVSMINEVRVCVCKPVRLYCKYRKKQNSYCSRSQHDKRSHYCSDGLFGPCLRWWLGRRKLGRRRYLG